jgi:ribA/ribD-fused uncharacterized protein
MIYTLENIQSAFEKEEQQKFLFFWGHRPTKDGSVSQSCFSQWWVAPFEVDGNQFQTAEHWMMYQKALLFNDSEIVQQVLEVEAPGAAKKLGRKVKGFTPEKWDQHKFEIVVQGNLYKFSQHEELKNFLLNTNQRVLVEASPVDRIWGIGMAKGHKDVNNPMRWKGENLLGFALMEVRDQLKTQ